ncbi:hypothetical protein [Flavonifractor sp. An100]|uniref:hypothetical protein n=1 Tax=Flavonifractor sp. An100 TaxID=1965538 RepID=UPI001302AD5D|nr:hypothetical protein [Flavonifractor sp. An100]
MKQQNSPLKQNATEMIVHGIVVRLIFSEQKNTAVPKRVGEILKSSYLEKTAG